MKYPVLTATLIACAIALAGCSSFNTPKPCVADVAGSYRMIYVVASGTVLDQLNGDIDAASSSPRLHLHEDGMAALTNFPVFYSAGAQDALYMGLTNGLVSWEVMSMPDRRWLFWTYPVYGIHMTGQPVGDMRDWELRGRPGAYHLGSRIHGPPGPRAQRGYSPTKALLEFCPYREKGAAEQEN